jgi:hypothetical protein
MVTDKEHDLEILKQRLPPKLRAYLDKKELDSIEVQAKKQRRTRSSRTR